MRLRQTRKTDISAVVDNSGPKAGHKGVLYKLGSLVPVARDDEFKVPQRESQDKV